METHTVIGQVAVVKVKKHGHMLVITIEGADGGAMISIGCHPDMAIELLIQARDLGLVPYGISFHVGSQQKDVVGLARRPNGYSPRRINSLLPGRFIQTGPFLIRNMAKLVPA